jgi:DNA gyrase subunit A
MQGNTRDTLYLVTESGETAAVAMHAIPESELADKGVKIQSVAPIRDGNPVTAVFSLPPEAEYAEGWHVMTVSRFGMVKKSELTELPGPAAQTFELAKTKPGDEIRWVLVTNGSDEIMLATAEGMAIRFSEEEVRPMGLLAAGVNGIKLKGKDEVVGACVVDKQFPVFLLTSEGIAKRVKANQFPTQGRYGQGVIAWKLSGDEKLVGIANHKPNFEVGIHLARLAAKRVRLDEAKVRTRPSNGNSVIDNMKEGVVALTVPWEVPDELLSAEAAEKKRNKPEAPPKEKPAKKTKAEQMQMDLDEKPKKKSTPKTKSKSKSAPKKKTSTRKSSKKK